MNNKERELLNYKLVSYLKKEVFTGCALGVSHLSDTLFSRNIFYVGRTDKKEGSLPIEKESFFDLASLTKPLVTLLSILALIKDEKIHFEDKIKDLLSGSMPTDKGKIRIKHLISHTSGLPPHKPYYEKLKKIGVKDRKKTLVNWILDEVLENTPGTSYIYSDLDYILLGYIVEEQSGEKLGNYWKRKISDPLNISNYFQFGKRYEKESFSNYVVTGECSWSLRPLCGVVHDDNCRALDCLSGHAGLFSTLEGVLALSENLLLQCTGRKEHPSINKENFLCVLQESTKKQKPYGFDIPSGKKSGSGRYFSDKSIGHLGFTGTSFWIDIEQEIIIVLLTNRVVFGEDSRKIKEMRPVIHDAVMSILNKY